MELTLTKALALLRTWQKNETMLNGSLFANSQEMQMVFAARIEVERETIRLTSERGDCDIRLTLTPAMGFIDSGKVLEIRAPSWRCVLHESVD